MPQAPRALGRLGLGLRLCAAVVWVVAGATKLPQMQDFRILVERYEILPYVLAAPFAYLLPFSEIAIAIYLGLGLFIRGTALVGTFFFVAFIAAQASVWARGLVVAGADLREVGAEERPEGADSPLTVGA
jgi:uncharacterized membrane protein YphA (DoxX/SURF4 family)